MNCYHIFHLLTIKMKQKTLLLLNLHSASIKLVPLPNIKKKIVKRNFSKMADILLEHINMMVFDG